jgi:hypothetical protein
MSDQPPSANTNKGSSLPDDASREAVKRMSVRGPSGTNFETLCDAWWLGRQSATDRRGHDAIRNVSGTDLQWRCNRDITELIKESVVAQPPSDPARDRLARMQGQSMRPDIDALAASVGSVGTDRRPTCKSLRDCSGPNCDCGQPAQQDSAGSDTVNTQYLTILGLCDTLVLMTKAQERLVQMLKARDGEEEYWPLMNDWVKDSGRAKALAFRNICRTVDAMVRDGLITVDDDGMVRLS